MKKNIAVVGCGHWGKNLVRNFSELGALWSICDPDNLVVRRFAEKYQVKNNSFNEIINDQNIEGVVKINPKDGIFRRIGVLLFFAGCYKEESHSQKKGKTNTHSSGFIGLG